MTPAEGPPQDMRALGRLPGGLEVEIRHRRATGGSGAEQVIVSVTAPAGFEAWGRLMEASNPMLAWISFVEAAWSPWLAMLGLPGARLPGWQAPRK